MYWKVLNYDENHDGFQYRTGVNTDTMPFDPLGSCESSGLCFSDSQNIWNFFCYGTWIRSVKPLTEVYEGPEVNTFKAHSIELGERMLIENAIPLLIADGWVMTAGVLIDAVCVDNIDLVKALLDAGCPMNDMPLRYAVTSDNKNMVRLLIDAGCPMTATVLRNAASRGNTAMVKMLIDAGCPQ